MADSRWQLATTALLGGLTGIKGGYNTRVLTFVLMRGPWTASEVEALAPVGSAIYFGYIVGCCATVPMITRISRRLASSLGEVLTILICVIAALIPPGLATLFVWRFALGCGISMCLTLKSLIVSERSPSPVRGRLGSLLGMCSAIGLLLTDVADVATHEWRLLILLGALPSLFLMPLVCTELDGTPPGARETPASGAQKSSPSGPSSFEVSEDTPLRSAQRAAHFSGRDSKQHPMPQRQGHARAMVTCALLALLKEGTGASVITQFSRQVVRTALGYDTDTYDLSVSLLVGAAMLVGCLFTFCTIDWLGRRKLVLLGGGGMGISMLLLASPHTVLACAGCVAWGTFYMMVHTTYWVLVPELLRAEGCEMYLGLAYSLQFLLSALGALAYGPIEEVGGTRIVYTIYGVAGLLLSAALGIFWARGAPDTRHLHLHEQSVRDLDSSIRVSE